MPFSGPVYALGSVTPTLAADAWVAPNATVIGDVWLGARSSVWFGCVLRGDTNQIRVGTGSNIQDGTIVHVNPGPEWTCIIGDDVTIGHAAIIHACRLHDRAFVGMGATVLDGAVIEEGGMLAAGALLTPGKRLGRQELWAGVPARKVRDMPDEERVRLDQTAVHYAALAARYRERLRSL